mgnify:CR=1 FL=1
MGKNDAAETKYRSLDNYITKFQNIQICYVVWPQWLRLSYPQSYSDVPTTFIEKVSKQVAKRNEWQATWFNDFLFLFLGQFRRQQQQQQWYNRINLYMGGKDRWKWNEQHLSLIIIIITIITIMIFHLVVT